MTAQKLTSSPHARKGAWAPLTELETRAIQHAAWLHRASTFNGGRPTLTISADFALELSRALRELVSLSRNAA